MLRIKVREFRDWMYDLVESKKGALPDLNDWKLIKQKLDQLDVRTVEDDGNYDCPGFDGYDFSFGQDGLINQFYDEYIRKINKEE